MKKYSIGLDPLGDVPRPLQVNLDNNPVHVLEQGTVFYTQFFGSVELPSLVILRVKSKDFLFESKICLAIICAFNVINN